MTTVDATLIDLLAADFAQVRVGLQHTRLMVELQDTTSHRAAVSECEAAMDAVLDLFLLVGQSTSLPRPVRSVTPAASEALTVVP